MTSQASSRRPSGHPMMVHLRVMRALFRREMLTRFGRTPGGYLWAILEPLSFILVLTGVFSLMAHMPPLGSSFVLFFATGYMAFTFYKATADFGSAGVQFNKALLNYPAVTPFDTVTARVILQFLTNYMVSILLFGGIFLFTDTPINLNVPLIFIATAGATLLAFGMAALNAVLFMRYPVYERVFGIVNRPLFLISGVFFLPEAMPTIIQDLLFFNPIAHYICLFRMGFYPEYQSTFLSIGYVWFWSIGLAFLGLAALTANRGAMAEN
ncbi:MAG: ABC transporter permease [Pseudomonadota bacterium]